MNLCSPHPHSPPPPSLPRKQRSTAANKWVNWLPPFVIKARNYEQRKFTFQQFSHFTVIFFASKNSWLQTFFTFSIQIWTSTLGFPPQNTHTLHISLLMMKGVSTYFFKWNEILPWATICTISLHIFPHGTLEILPTAGCVECVGMKNEKKMFSNELREREERERVIELITTQLLSILYDVWL